MQVSSYNDGVYVNGVYINGVYINGVYVVYMDGVDRSAMVLLINILSLVLSAAACL